MVQMLNLFLPSTLLYIWGKRSGQTRGSDRSKMVNTDNPHPQATVCPSVKGPLFQPNNNSQEDGGLVTIAHFSQLSPGALTVMKNGAGIIWGSGESRRKFLRRRLAGVTSP